MKTILTQNNTEKKGFKIKNILVVVPMTRGMPPATFQRIDGRISWSAQW
ncbi:hypothetical protein NLG42_22025 [Flavobacterium plurextorum]|nr:MULTISPECIES: hypothetical protein [Flavobacterium]UUW08766.1 hypothetical protein NLG42_22025 [Flavobacterium plurextorum]